MLICQCRGISEGMIRRCVRRGACRMSQVARTTGAGVGCGYCRTAVREVIRRELGSAENSVRPEAAPQAEGLAALH